MLFRFFDQVTGGGKRFYIDTRFQIALDEITVRIVIIHRKQRDGVWQKTGSGSIYSLAMEPVPVSSSMIREKILAGESIQGLMPQKVQELVEKRGLYR